MMRSRLAPGGGPVLAGLAACTLLLAGCSGGASDGSSSVPSSTASEGAAISAAPAPTPSPAPSGFLPVDSLGASEIPWDEVGPGWFMVTWVQRDVVWSEEVALPTMPADASVSLLAPDGTWYAAASLSPTGYDETVGWLGDTLAVFRVTEPSPAVSVGGTALVNLRTGASQEILSAAIRPSNFGFAADGTLVSAVYEEETLGVVWYDAQMKGHSVCNGAQDWSVAPDRSRVVCLAWVADTGTGDQTEILVGTLGSGAEAQVIDTFRLDPYSYHLTGWLDSDTFLVARAAQAGETKGTTYYTYNIVTHKVADFALPFAASSSSAWDVSYDAATETYAERGDDGLHVFAADGASIADVPCGGYVTWPIAVYSGTTALVECDNSVSAEDRNVTLTLVDLKDGSATVVADVNPGSDQDVRAVYPYVGNLD